MFTMGCSKKAPYMKMRHIFLTRKKIFRKFFKNFSNFLKIEKNFSKNNFFELLQKHGQNFKKNETNNFKNFILKNPNKDRFSRRLFAPAAQKWPRREN